MVSVGYAALAALVPACSSSDSGSAPAVNTATTGNATTGAVTYTKKITTGACDSCHDVDAGGSQGPNISGSTTAGLGGWTEEQFFQVVRNGKLPSGKTVCMEMERCSASELSDQDIADIFAFTQSKKVDAVEVGSYAQLDAACANK